MDQIAPVIKWIKKNVFWLGCGFLSVAMIGMWFFASSVLAEQTDKNTKTVKNNVSAAQGILNVKPADIEEDGAHPNLSTEEGMTQELSDTIDSIVEAWRIRKSAQEDILVWPKVIPSQQFIDLFSRFNPPETFPEEWASGVETQPMLELYRAKIPEQMAYLCKEILRTRWKYDPENATQLPAAGGDEGDDLGAAFGGGGGFGGGRGGGPPGGFGGMGGGMGGAGGMAATTSTVDYNNYAVRWSEKNQDLWYLKLTSFQGRDGNQFVNPKPLQAYMLQQELWLLEAMFKVIRQVNGDSNANDLSPIKTIDHVVFGREVGPELGELTVPDQRLAGKAPSAAKMGFPGGGAQGSGEEPDMEAMLGNFSRGKGAGMPGGDLGEAVAGSNVPYDRLYVDVNFEPLSAEVVKSVITGTELPDENLELIVAKRIPFRIALKMDERRIADFMAACANSPFAFEIQQVRWNKHKPGGEEFVLGGSGSGPGANNRDKLGGMGNDLGLGDFSAAASLDTKPVEVRTSYDVNVEFYGIVKIYNPVREDELRRAAGLVDENVDPSDAASTAKPAAAGDNSRP